MKRKRTYLILSALVACVAIAPLLRADSFDEAHLKSDQFIYDCKKIRALEKEEVMKLVKAICEADDDERQAISREISSRVKDEMNNEKDKLERQKDEADKLVEKVLADDTLKDKHSKIKEDKDKMKEVWESSLKLTESVRGGNHPVVAYMIEAGNRAHKEYQGNSSNCSVSEWPLSNGLKIDCLKSSPGQLIEIKPNNSRAKDRGRDQLRKYAVLNEDAKEQDELIKKYPDFKPCFENGKKLELKLALYTFCPEIDDDGNYRSTSYVWTLESP